VDLVVLSTGNVGIGDTSPASLFTVGNGDLFQVNSSGAIVAVTGITTTGNITLSGSAANIALGSNWLSGDGDDEGIFVNSTGKVGIGTSTPDGKGLHIFNGESGAAAPTLADELVIENNTSAGISILTSSTSDSRIRFGSDNDNTGGQIMWSGFSKLLTFGTNNASGELALSPGANNEAVRINSSGQVGIGTTSPASLLSIDGSGFKGTTTAGVRERYIFENNFENAVQFGRSAYMTASNTATTTLVGGIIRLEDNTTLGNTVRGLEVQAYKGNNTKGENTALSGFARTFGVRGSTEGDAGGVYEPAGVFANTNGTAQGNALRAYSNTITTAALVQLFQDTSSFAGTGLLMNFGNTSGSFASTASKFIDLQNAGTSKFVVSANGTTTIGDGTTMAGLQIGFGGLCVDNDGSCVASTTGRISSVSQYTGNSDLAEMYFSSDDLEPGEIVYTKGQLSVGRASQATKQKIIGVVSTKPGVTLGSDDSSLTAGENGYPIALTGRVPVLLSTENGPIAVGDELMLSSIPGVAMKATGTGLVIGVALEDYNGERAYSDTFINQFGDDIVVPSYKPISRNNDPRINDGCYYGGGNASGEEECVPLVATTTDGQIAEAEYLAAVEARDRELKKLAKIPAKVESLATGETVRVGKVTMFVDLRRRYFDEASETMIANLLTATKEADIDSEETTIWQRLVKLAGSFVDGVLSILELKADRIEVTNELCVEDVCINAEELKALLQASNNDGQIIEVLPYEEDDDPIDLGNEEDESDGDEQIVGDPEVSTTTDSSQGNTTDIVVTTDDSDHVTDGGLVASSTDPDGDIVAASSTSDGAFDSSTNDQEIDTAEQLESVLSPAELGDGGEVNDATESTGIEESDNAEVQAELANEIETEVIEAVPEQEQEQEQEPELAPAPEAASAPAPAPSNETTE